MPQWSKADRALLRDLRLRHSAADIAQEAAKVKNRKPGRPRHNSADVMVNALDFWRAVFLKTDPHMVEALVGHKIKGVAKMPFRVACDAVAEEARARGIKISGSTVRGMVERVEKMMNEPPSKERMATLLRFWEERYPRVDDAHIVRTLDIAPTLVFRSRR
jgi:hypothetical protein